MALRHPSHDDLRRFAIETADYGAAGVDVREHLEHCPRCRLEVTSIRDFLTLAATPATAPPGAFDVVRRRVSAGEVVLLPVEEWPSIRRRGPRRILVGLALLVASALLFIIRAPEARAARSELRVLPEEPQQGADIRIRYLAGAELAAESNVVLRARYRIAGQAPTAYTRTLGRLAAMGDGWFEGTVQLPDAAVYLVLAVEDESATVVDHNGEGWEILVHGPDGAPLLDALRHRYYEYRTRDDRIATETARLLFSEYPSAPAGLYLLFGELEAETPLSRVGDLRESFNASYRLVADSLTAASSAPTAEDLWYMVMLGRALGDDASTDRFTMDLRSRFPTSQATFQMESFALGRLNRGNPTARLRAFDSLWVAAGEPLIQVAFDGLAAARTLGDPETVLRWSARVDTVRPDWRGANAVSLVRSAGTRLAGMRRLRGILTELDVESAPRELTRTLPEHRAEIGRLQARYLAELGSGLLAEGLTTAALDTLSLAMTAGSWDLTLYQAIGESHLLLGDTLAARGAFARAAADPNTSTSYDDSVAQRVGIHTAEESRSWEALISSARRDLAAELAKPIPGSFVPRGEVTVRTAAGQDTTLALSDGVITVVALWSPYCAPSREDLASLDALAKALATHGVAFNSFPEASGIDEIRQFVASSGLTMPMLFDTERELRAALGNRGTPHYAVISGQGRVLFQSHTAADLARQVAVAAGVWDLWYDRP